MSEYCIGLTANMCIEEVEKKREKISIPSLGMGCTSCVGHFPRAKPSASLLQT